MSVTLVCGPPCAGKSTHVEQHAKPDDLILDLDAIAQQFGSPNTHTHKREYVEQANAWMGATLDAVAAGQFPDRDVWVVRCLPDRGERDEWAAWLGADVVLINAEPDVLLARAALRPHQWVTERAIRSWIGRFTP